MGPVHFSTNASPGVVYSSAAITAGNYSNTQTITVGTTALWGVVAEW